MSDSITVPGAGELAPSTVLSAQAPTGSPESPIQRTMGASLLAVINLALKIGAHLIWEDAPGSRQDGGAWGSGVYLSTT